MSIYNIVVLNSSRVKLPISQPSRFLKNPSPTPPQANQVAIMVEPKWKAECGESRSLDHLRGPEDMGGRRAPVPN